MICEHCQAQNSYSVACCKECGRPFSIRGKIDHYTRCALSGIVTYDTLAHAIGDGNEYKDSLTEENDRLTFAIYRIAQQTLACYSDFLYHQQRPKVLVSHTHKLSAGNVTDLLEMAGFPRQGAEALLKYQGIKHWLAGSILTMVFMELLRANVFHLLSNKDLLTVDVTYGPDFSDEQLCLARQANNYVNSQTQNHEAINSFMRAHITTLTEDTKMRVSLAVRNTLLEKGYNGKIACLPFLTQFFQTRVHDLTKEYELVLLITLLKTKCEAISDFSLDAAMAIS